MSKLAPCVPGGQVVIFVDINQDMQRQAVDDNESEQSQPDVMLDLLPWSMPDPGGGPLTCRNNRSP